MAELGNKVLVNVCQLCWQRAAKRNAGTGRCRTFCNVRPARESKPQLLVVAVRNSRCQVLAVGRHCEHSVLDLLQADLVVLVLHPFGPNTSNIISVALPPRGEQHAHGFPSNALHLARKHFVIGGHLSVRFCKRRVKTTNPGKTVCCGVRCSKVLSDLAAVTAERLPEQRRNSVGVHGHVAVVVLRVHNVIVEATDLVLVSELVANNFHLGFRRSGKNVNSLANAAVGPPSQLDFFGNALVIGAFARFSKASVRANNWVARLVLGLGAHADKPSLLLRGKLLELLTFQGLQAFKRLLPFGFYFLAAPAVEQQHSVLVGAVLTVLVEVRFNALGVANGSVLVLFELRLAAAHKPARAHCVVPRVVLVLGPDFHGPLGQLNVLEPVLLRAKHRKNRGALLERVVITGKLLRNNVGTIVPQVCNIPEIFREHIH